MKAAPMPPRQVSVEALLQEQVRQQLLSEPGKRASMRRLLTQGKVPKLLRHLSQKRNTPVAQLPEELCSILRQLPTAFQVSDAAEATSVQDIRVSVTSAGETEQIVEQKNFEAVWSTLEGGGAEGASKPGMAAPVPPQPPKPFEPKKGPLKPYKPYTPVGKKGTGATFGTSGAASTRQAVVQQTLQQLQELDNQKLNTERAERHVDGPHPPDHPPPGYKESKAADWKQFTPTIKRIPAPRRAGSSGSLENGSGQPEAAVNMNMSVPVPRPPPMPPSVPPSGFTSRPGSPQVPNGPQAVDNEGRPYDLDRVVVNFANVGATYGDRVLKRVKGKDYLFDYEGVRRCVSHLTQKLGLRVIGVIFENFHGAENGREVNQVPGDISAMCESIELTPRLLGHRHKCADDEMTIKCAYRRNCRFLDNDNYQDWRSNLADGAVRAWLLHCQEFLQMKFYFDSGLGEFDVLEGNIPAARLAQGPSRPTQGPSKRMCTRPWRDRKSVV